MCREDDFIFEKTSVIVKTQVVRYESLNMVTDFVSFTSYL